MPDRTRKARVEDEMFNKGLDYRDLKTKLKIPTEHIDLLFAMLGKDATNMEDCEPVAERDLARIVPTCRGMSTREISRVLDSIEDRIQKF